jgi:hypothetical protein
MKAKLPTNYVSAKRALAQCVRVDECVKWKSQASALASYGRQMKDQEMIHMAQRILDRAIRRGGELLAQVKKANPNKRGTSPKELKGTKVQFSSRSEMAASADLTPAQARTMLRVASVPEDTFESMVERPRPASVKELADEGTRKRKVEPEPHRNEYLDWAHAVAHLAALPACGLEVLATRGPYPAEQLIEECANAIRNLKSWQSCLERSNGNTKDSAA